MTICLLISLAAALYIALACLFILGLCGASRHPALPFYPRQNPFESRPAVRPGATEQNSRMNPRKEAFYENQPGQDPVGSLPSLRFAAKKQ